MTPPRRPVLRYHGGKFRLAEWVISHFPAHRCYVEPFGGAASVLMRKARAATEVYNDLDGDVVNLFRVLRDPVTAGRLTELLRLTPYAFEEFKLSYEVTDDPIEAARRTIVRASMGVGIASLARKSTSFWVSRGKVDKAPATDWAGFPSHLQAFTERLQGVTIENRPAIRVMEIQDAADTLHYVDPPYLSTTRNRSDAARSYRFEMSEADHVKLLDALRGLAGMVVLSGYPSSLYDDALADWTRHETSALAYGARPRTEALWLNPAAAERLEQEEQARRAAAEKERLPLFDRAELLAGAAS